MCLLTHLGVAGLILGPGCESLGEYAAPVRLCMINGMKKDFSHDENVRVCM